MMSSVNISDIVIAFIKIGDFRCIVQKISKSGAINLLKSSVVGDREYI